MLYEGNQVSLGCSNRTGHLGSKCANKRVQCKSNIRDQTNACDFSAVRAAILAQTSRFK